MMAVRRREETDQMQRTVALQQVPARIISLVPSITEFLLDIGAPVVGRTRFCVHPAQKIPEVPVIGGTKNFNFKRIDELKPDLLVGNKEENYPEGIRQLEAKYPVWMSDIISLEDQYDMMVKLGKLTGHTESAETCISQVRARMNALKHTRQGRAVYLIWRNPWMAAGKNTYIDTIMTHLGWQNCIVASRYPQIRNEALQTLDPEVILLSSEPYPFQEKHLAEVQQICPKARVELVNGELYSWYGSRIAHLL